MSAPAAAATKWDWPADLLAFAQREGIAHQLDPLLAMTRRLFPTATSIETFLEQDHELRDVFAIVFEVRVPMADVPDVVAAHRQWFEERRRMFPGPELGIHVLTLRREPA